MARFNPLILLGTAPLAQVAGMVWASKAPYGVRLAGTWGCVALALGCVAFVVFSFVADKKKQREEAERALERKKLKARSLDRALDARGGEIKPGRGGSDSEARRASAADRPSRGGS